MKQILILLFSLASIGCATQPVVVSSCPGDVSLPPQFSSDFLSIEDKALLEAALGSPGEGGLCEGQVYQSTVDSSVTLYRAWNSTNPNSEQGNWWAFYKPEGGVSQYREDYEICYQWSPLDMMVSCTLKPGAKVVVGPGQSARCSQYLNYLASDKKQIYIENAPESLSQCVTYEGEFSWKEVNTD